MIDAAVFLGVVGVLGDLVVSLASDLNQLSEIFETTPTRAAVTIAALGLLTGIGWVAKQVQTWLREHLSDFKADVVTLVVVGTTFVSAAGVTIGVWSLADDVERAVFSLPGGKEAAPLFAGTIVIFIVAHLLSRAGRRVVDNLVKRRAAFDEHEVEITYRVLQIGLWVTAIAVVLGLWRVDLTGVLVGAGFLGIVVGMAARQTLGAVLAGFVLMFARPFEIGDWVEIGEKEGIVTDISIVNTRVQTFDGEYVMIPNDIVSGQEVVNRSRKGRLRLEVEVNVDFDTDLPQAKQLCAAALEDVEDILSVPTPQVVVKEFGDSSILVGCRFWIDNPSARRKWRARTAVIEAVKAQFDEAGVKIPFPQRELSGREETDGFRHAPTKEVSTEKSGDDASTEADGEDAGQPSPEADDDADSQRTPEGGDDDIDEDDQTADDANGEVEPPRPNGAGADGETTIQSDELVTDDAAEADDDTEASNDDTEPSDDDTEPSDGDRESGGAS